MTNIFELLTKYGVEIPEDKKKDFEKDLLTNYKTVAEVSKKDAEITNLTEQLSTAKESLKAFEDVKPEELKAQITKLTNDLTAKDTEYKEKLAGIEFDHLVDSAIGKAKGKNAKAIKALLDIDTLKASKNQSEDISTALEGLKKDNDYLFDSEGTPSVYSSGSGTGARGGSEKNSIPQFI